MRLAEALVLRADINTHIAQLHNHIKNNALIQEGEKPLEDPQALLAELTQLLQRLGDLITAINRTNIQITLDQGMTITAALARRDILARQYDLFNSIANAASERFNRYSRSEIRIMTTVDIGTMRHQIDELARQRRELDTAIQAANWATELIE